MSRLEQLEDEEYQAKLAVRKSKRRRDQLIEEIGNMSKNRIADEPGNGQAVADAPDGSVTFIEGEIAECHQAIAESNIQLAQLQQQANQVVARREEVKRKLAGNETLLAKLRKE